MCSRPNHRTSRTYLRHSAHDTGTLPGLFRCLGGSDAPFDSGELLSVFLMGGIVRCGIAYRFGGVLCWTLVDRQGNVALFLFLPARSRADQVERMRRRRGEKRGRNGAGYIYACPRMGMGSITDHRE